MTIDWMVLGVLAAILAGIYGGLRVVRFRSNEEPKPHRRNTVKEWTATARLRRGAQSKSQATSGRTAQHGNGKSAMVGMLRNFIERHPYLPLLVMAVLDMAGHLIEDIDLGSMTIDAVVTKVCNRLSKSFSSINGFMALFPEEIFVAATAYSLSRKMRTLKEKESEVEEVVDKLKRTGQILEGIWRHGGGEPRGMPAGHAAAPRRGGGAPADTIT